jgi:ribosomal-protein-alanine N-acetyltransferase
MCALPAVLLAPKPLTTYASPMSIRLVQCDRRGAPVEPLGVLPPVLKENCEATAALFASIGFAPPWVGYVTVDKDQPVGGCAFVGAPKDGAVEIAYFTLEAFEGQGVSTQAVARMIAIAREADPAITITAKTLPQENASTTILRRNGFQFAGETSDDEIGLAWAWVLRP